MSDQDTGDQEDEGCDDWEDFSSNLSDDEEGSEEKAEPIPARAGKKITESLSIAPYTLSTGPSYTSEEMRTQNSKINKPSEENIEAR